MLPAELGRVSHGPTGAHPVAPRWSSGGWRAGCPGRPEHGSLIPHGRVCKQEKPLSAYPRDPARRPVPPLAAPGRCSHDRRWGGPPPRNPWQRRRGRGPRHRRARRPHRASRVPSRGRPPNRDGGGRGATSESPSPASRTPRSARRTTSTLPTPTAEIRRARPAPGHSDRRPRGVGQRTRSRRAALRARQRSGTRQPFWYGVARTASDDRWGGGGAHKPGQPYRRLIGSLGGPTAAYDYASRGSANGPSGGQAV